MATKNSFEKSINRLEELVAKLESGELSLEDSMKLFEEGTGLVADCMKKLDAAEQKVLLLRRELDGTPATVDFKEENI